MAKIQTTWMFKPLKISTSWERPDQSQSQRVGNLFELFKNALLALYIVVSISINISSARIVQIKLSDERKISVIKSFARIKFFWYF